MKTIRKGIAVLEQLSMAIGMLGVTELATALDMDKAIARIQAALANKERILIYGDYDVDGVTSMSIMCLT